MDSIDLKLCKMQGRLFELTVQNKLDSNNFISAFMKSDTAKHLDLEYDRTQWAGEEYLLAELIDTGDYKVGDTLDVEVMYWIGYIYRYWHLLTGESSKDIVKQASPKIMETNYYMFHSMDPQMAIENLKEVYNQSKN